MDFEYIDMLDEANTASGDTVSTEQCAATDAISPIDNSLQMQISKLKDQLEKLQAQGNVQTVSKSNSQTCVGQTCVGQTEPIDDCRRCIGKNFLMEIDRPNIDIHKQFGQTNADYSYASDPRLSYDPNIKIIGEQDVMEKIRQNVTSHWLAFSGVSRPSYDPGTKIIGHDIREKVRQNIPNHWPDLSEIPNFRG